LGDSSKGKQGFFLQYTFASGDPEAIFRCASLRPAHQPSLQLERNYIQRPTLSI